jgi:hypothetical protein
MNKLTASTAIPTTALKREALTNISASFELLCLASSQPRRPTVQDAPFALTLSLDPRRSFVDETSGARVKEIGAVFAALADREFVADRLFGAFNLIYEMARTRLPESFDTSREATLDDEANRDRSRQQSTRPFSGLRWLPGLSGSSKNLEYVRLKWMLLLVA